MTMMWTSLMMMNFNMIIKVKNLKESPISMLMMMESTTMTLLPVLIMSSSKANSYMMSINMILVSITNSIIGMWATLKMQSLSKMALTSMKSM